MHNLNSISEINPQVNSKNFYMRKVTRDEWIKLVEELIQNKPSIRLEYNGKLLKSKLLARKISNDLKTVSFIISPPEPDLSKEIIGDRKQIGFYALYLIDDLQHYISSKAILEQYILYYGYPALVLTIMPPIKHYSQISVSYPSVENPVHLNIPVRNKPVKIAASEISSQRISTESNTISEYFRLEKKLNNIDLKLPQKNKMRFEGILNRIEDDRIVIDIKQIAPEDRLKLINYLQQDFEDTFGLRINHLIRMDKETSIVGKGEKIEFKPLILIIDDEKDPYFPLLVLFDQNNYQYEFADDGEIGVRKARIAKPDLIFLDMNMPRMDGLRTLKLLKTFPLTKDIPVIMMTASADFDTVTKTCKYNISGYISKPYQPNDVIKRVNQLFRSMK